jgi:hypothetical protein
MYASIAQRRTRKDSSARLGRTLQGVRLQFEAVSQFPEEERRIVKALLEGMIIKFQTKQMVGNVSS